MSGNIQLIKELKDALAELSKDHGSQPDTQVDELLQRDMRTSEEWGKQHKRMTNP